MTTNSSAMLLKIKKLLNLSEGTHSINEAQSAMMKAQELLLSNGLSMEEVENAFSESKKQEVEDCRIEKKTSSLPFWHIGIAQVIAENFRCFFYRRKEEQYGFKNKTAILIVVGLATDVKVCKETIQYCISVCNTLWTNYRKIWKKENPYTSRFDTENMKNSYMRGFEKGLKSKFEENVVCKDLIIIKDSELIENWEDRKMTTSTIRKQFGLENTDAHSQGYEDGKKSIEGKGRYIDE